MNSAPYATRWIFFFLFIVFVGDRLLGGLLQRQSHYSQFRYSRMYRGTAAADVLLLGNSRGLTFYQPYIEAKTGLSTCNLSYNGLPMDVAKALVFDYLERYPAPKKLVVDVTTADRINDELLTGFVLYAPQSYHLDTLLRGKKPYMWWGGKLSTLFQVNNELFQRALYYRNRSDEDWLLDRVIAPKLAAQAASQSYVLDSLNMPYLVKNLTDLVQASRQRGVTVELVVSPYFPQLRVVHLEALKAAVTASTGLPVRDYQNALTDPADFGDFMHPNKAGALKYVDLLLRDGVLQ
jgi:hypothetical protein